MKKNAIIIINENTAQVTKAFQKQARIFGTEEYKMWKAYCEDYPGAQMKPKTIKRNANKRTYRNLTYVNMELYISVNNPQLMKECQRRCDFVIFRRRGNVRNRRVKVCSL